MLNRLAPYAGALLLLQGLTACSRENDAAQQPSQGSSNDMGAAQAPVADGKLILAFGDSLYAGYGVEPRQSFPAMLEQSLRKDGLAVTVQNAGVSGDTTAAALRRLAFTLDGLPRKPDLAMVNLGGNDMLRGIDPTETRKNLTAICEELHKRGIPIMLTGMVAAPNMGKDYAARFNPIYGDLAKRYDAVLYPFFLDGVITRPELMQADSVHPKPQGIALITSKVEPLVAKALNRP